MWDLPTGLTEDGPALAMIAKAVGGWHVTDSGALEAVDDETRSSATTMALRLSARAQQAALWALRSATGDQVGPFSSLGAAAREARLSKGMACRYGGSYLFTSVRELERQSALLGWFKGLLSGQPFTNEQLSALFKEWGIPPPIDITPQTKASELIDAIGTLSVETAAHCPWNVTSEAPWLVIAPSVSAIGTKEATFVVIRNLTGATRTGVIRVNTTPIEIRQAPEERRAPE